MDMARVDQVDYRDRILRKMFRKTTISLIYRGLGNCRLEMGDKFGLYC